MKKLLIVALLALSAPLFAENIGGGIFGPASKIRNILFANLGAPVAGNVRYCTNCAPTNPCTGSGSGAFAFRTGTAWNCGAGAGTTVNGPASSTDNAVARFDGTAGNLLQNSVLIVDDTGVTSGVSTLQTSGHVGVGVAPSGSAGVLVLAREDANQTVVSIVQNADAASANAAACQRGTADTSTIQICAYGTGFTAGALGLGSLGGWSALNSTAGNGVVIGPTGAKPLRLSTNNLTGMILDGTNPHPSFPVSDKCTTAQFDKTSDVTLANITGLSVNLTAAKRYKLNSILHTTSNAAGGVKFAVSGTATATSIIYHARCEENTAVTIGTNRSTALGTTVGDVTAVTAATCYIDGAIVVNAAGTLTLQFAQNASNGTASSVLINSCMSVREW